MTLKLGSLHLIVGIQMLYTQVINIVLYFLLDRRTAVLKVKIDIIASIYGRESDGTSSDTSENVCQDLQNGHYCLYLY